MDPARDLEPGVGTVCLLRGTLAGGRELGGPAWCWKGSPHDALRSEEGGAATGDLSTAYELLKKQVAQKRCVEMRQFVPIHTAQFFLFTPRNRTLFTGASRCGTCSRS